MRPKAFLVAKRNLVVEGVKLTTGFLTRIVKPAAKQNGDKGSA